MPLSPYQQVQQVKDHYNTIGLHFAETRKKRLWPEILPFVAQVKPGMRVLDVGCGSGRLLTELGGKKIYYLGIDFSQVLIDQAKKRFPKRRFLVRDITTSDGWKNIGQFDAVFCLGVFHHIPDRNRQHEVMKQIFKHTKADGFAVFSIWNLWQTRFWKYHFNQLSKKLQYNDFSFVWVPYSVSDGQKTVKRVWRFCKAFFPGEFLRLVKQTGFSLDTFYFAAKGQIRLSIFNGQNFCLLARKKV
ncbi:methyltransferase domain-containing protein [Candidatus Beckwithbacteria bacterium]|nr:methyltransferase domain-containing protein [Candidatus Beckwithbacteria bacterium]